jgi:antitoxin component YwqK of YwqJK toxin-antitoxin module
MENIINNKIKLIKIGLDYYQLLEILKYTKCGNKFELRTSNKKIGWYVNGHLGYRRDYTEGDKLNGLYERWYDNGQLSIRTNYKDNKINGLYEGWYQNGQLECRRNYTEEGKLNGLSEWWYPNGQIWIRTNYIDGKNID